MIPKLLKQIITSSGEITLTEHLDPPQYRMTLTLSGEAGDIPRIICLTDTRSDAEQAFDDAYYKHLSNSR